MYDIGDIISLAVNAQGFFVVSDREKKKSINWCILGIKTEPNRMVYILDASPLKEYGRYSDFPIVNDIDDHSRTNIDWVRYGKHRYVTVQYEDMIDYINV